MMSISQVAVSVCKFKRKNVYHLSHQQQQQCIVAHSQLHNKFIYIVVYLQLSRETIICLEKREEGWLKTRTIYAA